MGLHNEYITKLDLISRRKAGYVKLRQKRLHEENFLFIPPPENKGDGKPPVVYEMKPLTKEELQGFLELESGVELAARLKADKFIAPLMPLPITLNNEELPLMLDDGYKSLMNDLTNNLFKMFDLHMKFVRSADDWEPAPLEIEKDASAVPIPTQPQHFVDHTPASNLNPGISKDSTFECDLVAKGHLELESRVESVIDEAKLVAEKKLGDFDQNSKKLKTVTDEEAKKLQTVDDSLEEIARKHHAESDIEKSKLTGKMQLLNRQKRQDVERFGNQFANDVNVFHQKYRDSALRTSDVMADDVKTFFRQLPTLETAAHFQSTMEAKKDSVQNKLYEDEKNEIINLRGQVTKRMADIYRTERDQYLQEYHNNIAKLKDVSREHLGRKKADVSQQHDRIKLMCEKEKKELLEDTDAFMHALKAEAAKKAAAYRRMQKRALARGADTAALRPGEKRAVSDSVGVSGSPEEQAAANIDLYNALRNFKKGDRPVVPVTTDDLKELRVELDLHKPFTERASTLDNTLFIELTRAHSTFHSVPKDWDPATHPVAGKVPLQDRIGQSGGLDDVDLKEDNYLHFDAPFFEKYALYDETIRGANPDCFTSFVRNMIQERENLQQHWRQEEDKRRAQEAAAAAAAQPAP